MTGTIAHLRPTSKSQTLLQDGLPDSEGLSSDAGGNVTPRGEQDDIVDSVMGEDSEEDPSSQGQTPAPPPSRARSQRLSRRQKFKIIKDKLKELDISVPEVVNAWLGVDPPMDQYEGRLARIVDTMGRHGYTVDVVPPAKKRCRGKTASTVAQDGEESASDA
jgi:hypothetical protein